MAKKATLKMVADFLASPPLSGALNGFIQISLSVSNGFFPDYSALSFSEEPFSFSEKSGLQW
jgi:hypothetical protein